MLLSFTLQWGRKKTLNGNHNVDRFTDGFSLPIYKCTDATNNSVQFRMAQQMEASHANVVR